MRTTRNHCEVQRARLYTLNDRLFGQVTSRTHHHATPTRCASTRPIGELSTRSEEFRARWAAHQVKLHRTGVKRFHHPVVGELILDFEMLDLR